MIMNKVKQFSDFFGTNTTYITKILQSDLLPLIKTGKTKTNYFSTTEILETFKMMCESYMKENSFDDLTKFLKDNGLSYPSDLNTTKNLKAEVLTFTNHKGGVGKTTITINVAAVLAFLGFRVCIVDMDTQANASFYLQDEEKYDEDQFVDFNITHLYKHLNENKEITKEVVKKAIYSIKDFASFDEDPKTGFSKDKDYITLDLIPSDLALDFSLRFTQMQMNHYKYLDRILETIKDDYDFILIDTPPSHSTSVEHSLYAADKITLCSNSKKLGRRGVELTIQYIKDLSEDVEKNIEINGLFVTDYANQNNQSDEYNKLLTAMIMNGSSPDDVYKISRRALVETCESHYKPIFEYKEDVETALDTATPIFKFCKKLIENRLRGES